MPSIANMLKMISAIDSPFVTVHQERCALVRNRNADCLRCAEACTSGCISFDGEELAVDPEKCIGCGTCATACPTCALEAHHPNDAQLLDDCRRSADELNGRVVIACAELLRRAHNLYDGKKVARVECLGRVEETLITTLIANGAREVVLVGGACASCEHATGRSMAERVVETERQLLDAWDSDASVRISSKLPGSVRASNAGFDESKREAFGLGKQEAARVGGAVARTVAADALGVDTEEKPPERYAKVTGDGTLPHFLPDRRERLLDALARMGEPEDVMIDTRLWGHVVIDTDLCNSCRMCAVFCPTGALRKFDRDDGTFGVEHYPGDCVKCCSCASICPAGALTISEEVFAHDILEGMTDAYEMCKPAVAKGEAHSIWHTAKTFFDIDEIYER